MLEAMIIKMSIIFQESYEKSVMPMPMNFNDTSIENNISTTLNI